jgi:hypothetical protein
MTQPGNYGGEQMTDYQEDMNWDNVGVPVPVGDYDCEIVKMEYAQDKNKKHMLKVQFKIEAAYNPENIDKGVGRQVFDNWSFTQSGGFRPKDFALAGNVQLPVTINKVVLEEWAASLIGFHIGVRTSHREWNGQTMSQIQKFLPYQAGTVAPDAAAAEAPQQVQQQPQPKPVQQTLPTQAATPQPLRQAMATQQNGRPAQTPSNPKPRQPTAKQ